MNTSAQPRTPLSSSTDTRPPTASTTAGSASSEAAAPSTRAVVGFLEGRRGDDRSEARIEITQEQARALAELAEREGGSVSLHQVAAIGATGPVDVYATPNGAANGYRIAADGHLTPIGETLPAA